MGSFGRADTCGFEELTRALWLSSLAKYFLVSTLAIHWQVVWRRFYLEIVVFWEVVTDGDSSCNGKAVDTYGGETAGVG